MIMFNFCDHAKIFFGGLAVVNILVLEDDHALRMAFCEALEGDGHTICSAATTQDAEHHLTHEIVDLLLIDLFIGDSTSLPVTRAARKFAPNARSILATGAEMWGDDERAASDGSIAWTLQKPVSMADFSQLVNHAATRSKT